VAISRMPTFTFTLVQKAKSLGGDKYMCDSNKDFIIYVPQSESRTDKVPSETLKITIEKE
jgi:hypothetical protein